MEPNLIKDEGGLDLHPKKTVICPKKIYRETLLNNVNSKDFKTKDRNKLTSKTPLKPMIKNILPEEDLDTKSSDDDIDPRLLQFDDEQRLRCDSEDFEDSENSDNEEPVSTESEIDFTRPLPDASSIFYLFGNNGGKPRMVLESDSDDDEINLSD